MNKEIKYYNDEVTPKQLAQKIAEIASEKKGDKINIFNVKKVSSITDYLVVISGYNSRHTQTLAAEIELQIKKNFSIFCRHIDGNRTAEWIVLDFLDVIVHIFLPETREHYALERLWADAPVIDA